MTETAVTPEVARRFSEWQQSLVPGNEATVAHEHIRRRQALLNAAADSSSRLADYLTEVLQPTDSAWDGCPDIEPIDVSEMHSPCLDWETHIGGQMTQVTSLQALSAPWWYLCHIKWLKDGVLPDPPDETFKCRVGENTRRTDPSRLGTDAHADVNRATRLLLRWLGGLPHIRHAKGVATDPPVARALWRYRMAQAAAEESEGNIAADACHRVLLTGGGWSRFVDVSQVRYSSLLHPRAFAALCYACTSNDNDNAAITNDTMQTVARRCLDHHPALMPWDKLTSP